MVPLFASDLLAGVASLSNETALSFLGIERATLRVLLMAGPSIVVVCITELEAMEWLQVDDNGPN